MSSFRIASRYAKSLIGLAKERGNLDVVFSDIKSVDDAFESSRELRVAFKSPIIPGDKKLAIFNKLFATKLDKLVLEFFTLLIKKGREEHIHEIVNSFIEQYNGMKGITPVIIRSAVKLDAGMVQSIVTSLKTREKLDRVELHEEIDETLIGGFVLLYGDKMIDSSVKRKIHELRNIIEDDSYIKKY